MSDSDATPEQPEQPPAAPAAPSTPSTSAPAASTAGVKLSTGQIVLLASAAVIFICSFFSWIHASVSGTGGLGGAGDSANGWHHMGGLVAILAVVLLVVAGAQIAKVLPLGDAMNNLVVAGLAALTLLLGIINVIVWLTDSHLGTTKTFGVSVSVSLSFGFYIGVLALIALAYAVFDMVKSGDVLNTAKGLQNNS
ncbi:MAG TPA: hypothetical protein VF426_11600 [Marmoricola sp.]